MRKNPFHIAQPRLILNQVVRTRPSPHPTVTGTQQLQLQLQESPRWPLLMEKISLGVPWNLNIHVQLTPGKTHPDVCFLSSLWVHAFNGKDRSPISEGCGGILCHKFIICSAYVATQILLKHPLKPVSSISVFLFHRSFVAVQAMAYIILSGDQCIFISPVFGISYLVVNAWSRIPLFERLMKLTNCDEEWRWSIQLFAKQWSPPPGI